MTKITRVAIAGANGRMGREILLACLNDTNVEIAAAYVRVGSEFIGKDISTIVGSEQPTNIFLSSQEGTPQDGHSQNNSLADSVDVLIDFTLTDNAITNLQRCVVNNVAMVIGTTGFTKEQQTQINDAAMKIPLLQASNTSVGVNLTLALLKMAADVLGDSSHISISETHHIHKMDAPSGTAITMAEVIANSLNKKVADCIEINSIREGEVIGDHTVSFIMDDERIEITHKAANRQVFAKGAIKAARWLSGKKPGHYSMADVLGLSVT